MRELTELMRTDRVVVMVTAVIRSRGETDHVCLTFRLCMDVCILELSGQQIVAYVYVEAWRDALCSAEKKLLLDARRDTPGEGRLGLGADELHELKNALA